jgi:DNA polymerase III epsilon subunit-like protein
LRTIVFDTETTGIGPDKEAVEIALIEINPETLEEEGRAEALLNVRSEISPEAEAVHGISKASLADKPYIEEWVERELGGPLEGEVALIGHRVAFDRPLFAPLGTARWSVDTLLLTQLHLPPTDPAGVTGPVNRKLDSLKDWLGLEGGGTSHRAMADCLTCLQLLRHLLPLTGRTLPDIARTEFFMVHYMPWGKHEDKPLIEVPKKYRDWLLSLPDLDTHLRRSLELIAAADVPLLPRPANQRGRIFIPRRNSA